MRYAIISAMMLTGCTSTPKIWVHCADRYPTLTTISMDGEHVSTSLSCGNNNLTFIRHDCFMAVVDSSDDYGIAVKPTCE